MRRGTPSQIAVLCLAALPLAAQTPSPTSLTVDFVFGEEAKAAAKIPEFAWTTGDDVLLLDETQPPSRRTIERIRARDGVRTPAVDAAAALASLSALSPEDVPKSLPWPDALNPAGTAAVFVFGDDLYLLDFATSRFTRLGAAKGAKETLPRFSPDGRRVAFVRDNDLWTVDLASNAETRLTTDGSPTTLNGTLSWVYWEEIFDRGDTGYWWSADSRSIAYLRTDDSPVDVAVFTDIAPAVPREIRQRYPRTGRPNPTVRLGVVPASGGATTWMDPAAAPYEYILGVEWLPDSRALAVQTTDRPQTRLDVWRFDVASGRPTLFLSESDPALVYQKEIRFADGGKTWIVSSEVDGFTHLFRYVDGARKNAVTRGAWSVRGGRFYGAPQGSAFVDGDASVVYFTAIEKSPLESHLYRIRPDGTGMARITREDGTHRVKFSPDFRYFVDAYSNRDTLPGLYLCDASGKRLATLWGGSMDLLAPYGLTKREFVTIPAAEGFALPASLLKPPGFDPSKKYPVLIHVYGGPGAPIVQDRWQRDDLFDHLLAQNGYVIASFDPRSATGRNKKLEDLVVRRMMSDVELGDLRSTVQWLKAQPWADPARFGIWGWSGGGSYTLLAMTRTQEFKAGISGAPVTNWDYYDSKFGEAYMKTRADNPEGYVYTSFVERAKDLSGRLLLVFGSYDDNVHPQNGWAFADALVAAGKPFDIMVYPMQKHSFTSDAAIRHRAAKMLEFWKLYL